MLQLGREIEARLPAPGTEVGPSSPAPPPNPQRLPSLPSPCLVQCDQAITPSRYLTSTPGSLGSLLDTMLNDADIDESDFVMPKLPEFDGEKK